jgi:hypothetical protein
VPVELLHNALSYPWWQGGRRPILGREERGAGVSEASANAPSPWAVRTDRGAPMLLELVVLAGALIVVAVSPEYGGTATFVMLALIVSTPFWTARMHATRWRGRSHSTVPENAALGGAILVAFSAVALQWVYGPRALLVGGLALLVLAAVMAPITLRRWPGFFTVPLRELPPESFPVDAVPERASAASAASATAQGRRGRPVQSRSKGQQLARARRTAKSSPRRGARIARRGTRHPA